MSTRSTIWYQDEDELENTHFHIYKELLDTERTAYLEITGGQFCFCGPLPEPLARIVLTGIQALGINRMA